MTISTTFNRTFVTGIGVTASVPFPWAVTCASDLRVLEVDIATGVESLKTLNRDYTISFSNGCANGATITASLPIPCGKRWVVYRDVPIHNAEPNIGDIGRDGLVVQQHDRMMLIAQRLNDRADRSLRIPDGDLSLNTRLPSSVSRAGKILAFDNNGNVETAIASGEVQAAIAGYLSGASVTTAVSGFAPSLAAAKAMYGAGLTLANGHTIAVAGRADVNDGYAGNFSYKAGDSTTVFPSDGRGFVDSHARRWFRQHQAGIVSAQWYGAVGNGAANDYAAIQSAIDDVRGVGQSTILLPFGIYLNDTQAWNFSGVSVHGFSRIGSILKRGPNTSDLYLWKLDGSTSGGAVLASYRDFRTDGSTAGNSNANWCIGLIGNVLYNKFENLDVVNFKTGALRFAKSNSTRPNLNTFDNCSFRDGSGDGVDMRAGGMIEFRNFSVENVGGSFFKVSGADEAVGPLLVENFWFENSGDGNIDGVVVDAASSTSDPIVFRHGRVQFYGNRAGTQGNGVNLVRGSHCTIDGVIIGPRAGSSVAQHRKIVISSNSGSNVIKNINLVQTDVDNQSGSTTFENCNLGFQRLTFANAETIAGGSTVYLGAGSTPNGSIGQRRIRWGGNDSIAGLFVDMGPLPGAGKQYSIGLMKNGRVAGIETTLVDGNNGTNSNSFSIGMTPNDTLEMRVITMTGAAPIPAGGLRVTVLVYK